MLTVTPLSEAIELVLQTFGGLRTTSETVSMASVPGRVLAEDLKAAAFVPGFNRSTVDGYAVRSRDVFGSSDSIPALLKMVGSANMGKVLDFSISPGECAYIPTGAEVPEGADTMVMLEHAEVLAGDQVAIYKPAAPGANIIQRGEDTKPGEVVLPAGRRINAADIGSLAALGVTEVLVMRPPRVAIISTGDELVQPTETPGSGQIRDVNTPMLAAAVAEAGGLAHSLGIIRDAEDTIRQTVVETLKQCDVLLVSGGTSVGEKDAMPRVLAGLGKLLVHGLAVKPGKPTLFGEVNGIPVFGLPGNPVAAYFMFYLLVRPLLFNMQRATILDRRITLPLARTLPSNHGREEIVPVLIREGQVHPVASRSGLITTLASTDGFIRVARDLEGIKQGELVDATLFAR